MIELGFLSKDPLVTLPLLCGYIIIVSQTLILLFSSHSVMSNTVTPWTAACQASLSFTISWGLLKLMSIESVMPFNHLILCHSLLLLFSILPSIRVFSNKLALHIRWSKYWSFNFSISPSSEYSTLIFRIDWLDLLVVQGTLKSLLQHHSSKRTVLRLSNIFMVQLSYPYMTPGKTIDLTYTDLCQQSDVSAF